MPQWGRDPAVTEGVSASSPSGGAGIRRNGAGPPRSRRVAHLRDVAQRVSALPQWGRDPAVTEGHDDLDGDCHVRRIGPQWGRDPAVTEGWRFSILFARLQPTTPQWGRDPAVTEGVSTLLMVYSPDGMNAAMGP